MVLDTSALLAILQGEPEQAAFIAAIHGTARHALSAANYVETAIVVECRFGADGVRDLDLFLGKAGTELVPVDAHQAHLARKAYRDYGKGRHPAGLDYGDCFAYALARARAEPLLFKGNDFVHTDLARAVNS